MKSLSRTGASLLAAVVITSVLGSPAEAAGGSAAPQLNPPSAASAAAQPGLPAPTVNRIRLPRRITVRRGGPARKLRFKVRRGGEGVIRFTVTAPRVSWGAKGAEAAVASIYLDRRYVTDLLVPSATPTSRRLALGRLSRGRHRLTIRFAKDRSAKKARSVTLRNSAIKLTRGADRVVLAHAPVVVGRTLAQLGDAYQNARTDAPLIGWHEERPATTPGNRILEYSVIWSNEDGGTNTPALMARWGRTTDIEWVYRVEVDRRGRRVPGSGVYQAANHQTLVFNGKYDGDHPVLQTCTVNNNMCDVVTIPPGAKPMRFFLDTSGTRPESRAREVVMDRTPWSYQIMAREMVREGKIEKPSDPATPEVGDQRTYLFIEVKKETGPPTGTGPIPGIAVGVRLKKSPDTVYRSDHSVLSWAIERDLPAATTVELPQGTTIGDIAKIDAIRQPMGLGDNGAPVTVTSINRGFFLGRTYLPRPSAVTWSGSKTLTPAAPSATIWEP